MGEKTMEIIKERKKTREKIIKKAKKWAQSLKIPCTAILIGSYARGDFNLWSDIDIVIISPTFKGNPIERLKTINTPPGYEIIPITPQELNKLLKKKEPLALEILKQGITLRDDLKIKQRPPNKNTT